VRIAKRKKLKGMEVVREKRGKKTQQVWGRGRGKKIFKGSLPRKVVGKKAGGFGKKPWPEVGKKEPRGQTQGEVSTQKTPG